MITFEEINKLANNEAYLMKLLPKAEKKGNEIICGSIFGNMKGDGFSYNIKSGLWSDFSTQRTGSSVIELIMARENCSPNDAAEIINRDLNIDNSVLRLSTDGNKTFKYEVSGDKGMALRKLLYADKTMDIEKMYPYFNQDGLVAYDCVIKDENKEKILNFLYDSLNKEWYQGIVDKDRVIYNLRDIISKKDKTIIIVDEPKMVEAASKYFPNYAIASWQGGLKCPNKTNWSFVAGRKVIMFPSNNDGSVAAHEKIAEILRNRGSYVRIIDISSMDKGWTIYDALQMGTSQKDIIDFVKNNIKEFSPKIKDEIIDPEIIIKKDKRKVIYDDSFFRCLGVRSDSHYFYNKNTSQIVEFRPSYYDSKHLISLAPLSWWQTKYPARKDGVDWLLATDDLCRIQEKIGVFDNTKIRGRGAWFDNGRTVLHLGNIMYTDGRLIDVDKFESDYFYEKAPSLAVKIQSSLPATDSRRLIDLCRLIRWENPYYGDILAGWMFSALVCGAMSFRSHLYMIGAAGTGKSWVLDNIVKPIMGKMALSISSKSTEAGIRDQLGGDIRPVIFDEAEAENNNDKVRMQAIFDLARNGSSENADAIVKFGAKYVCRSAFLFASINSSMSKTADLSRTAFIKLANAPTRKSDDAKRQDNNNFRKLESEASRLLTDEYCRCLLSRAIALVPILRKSHRIIADLAAKEFGSRRLGDQMAMVISGLWGLQSDQVISEAVARSLIEQTCIQSDKADLDDQTQEEKALDHLLFSNIETQTKLGVKHYILSLLISIISGHDDVEGLNASEVKQDLASKGIILSNIGSKQYMFLAVNKAALPSKIFNDTEWSYGWQDALLRIEGVEKTSNRYFCRTLTSKAIAVPLDYIIKDPQSLL